LFEPADDVIVRETGAVGAAEPPQRAAPDRARPARALVVGVIVAPWTSSQLAAGVCPDLAERIALRLPDAQWRSGSGEPALAAGGPARAAAPDLLTVSSIIAVGATIVIGAGLRERQPPEASASEQVILFSMVTVTTVIIGELALYLVRLVVMLVGAFLLVPRQSLVNALGHQVGVGGVVALAWLATPVATVGGALGAVCT
jgi:hypothetical protein